MGVVSVNVDQADAIALQQAVAAYLAGCDCGRSRMSSELRCPTCQALRAIAADLARVVQNAGARDGTAR